jgi:RNA polymerase sigma factor (sigma-70 family)
MAEHLPPALAELLSTQEPEPREIAWERFLVSYSPLLLKVAQRMARGYDEAMDHYTFVLDHLRARDYERLRSYAVHPQSEFTTWLVVVARRLCLDRYRCRYGRGRCSEPPAASAQSSRAARRRLMDAVFEPPSTLAQLAAESGDPAAALDLAERQQLLDAAIASLAPADQQLLKLRFEDELPARTIAAILAWPTDFHVYRRLRTVLSSLRKQLGGAGREVIQ